MHIFVILKSAKIADNIAIHRPPFAEPDCIQLLRPIAKALMIRSFTELSMGRSPESRNRVTCAQFLKYDEEPFR